MNDIGDDFVSANSRDYERSLLPRAGKNRTPPTYFHGVACYFVTPIVIGPRVPHSVSDGPIPAGVLWPSFPHGELFSSVMAVRQTWRPARVARLAFLTPQTSNLAYFKHVWRIFFAVGVFF